MSRWKAAGIHFAVSVVVAVAAIGLLFVYWYPGALFEATGGQRLIYLIVGIDVVAGPLLTLIVFKSGKPGLKTDIALICAAQLAFLVYGFYIATQARPIFIVFRGDRFAVVSSNDLGDDDLAQAPEEFRRRSLTGPVYVATESPANAEELQALLTSALEGRDIDKFPKYYRPYGDYKGKVAAAGRPLEELAQLGDAQRAEVERFLATREDDADLVYVPVAARFKNMSAIVSRTSGEILELLRVDPWPAEGATVPTEPAPEPAPAPVPASPAAEPPASEAPGPEPAEGGDAAPAPAPEPETNPAPTDSAA